MNFYIIDDDIGVVSILTRIVETDPGNEVIGTSYDGDTALRDLLVLPVDIVLVDLLLPRISGNELVREVKSFREHTKFVMISQVTSIELREEAYEAGIEFFINKPVNVIEVRKVIIQVAEKLDLEMKLSRIQSVIQPAPCRQELERADFEQTRRMKKIRHILNSLGMAGEKGTQDIIRICEYMTENQIRLNQLDYMDCPYINNGQKKIILQRIRRAIRIGLTNVASLGLHDYDDDIFLVYANSFFDFTNVRNEMNYIQGKSDYGGKVQVHKFLEGLLQESTAE